MEDGQSAGTVPPILQRLGEFFRTAIQSLVRYAESKSSFTVGLPHLNEVPVEDIDLGFRILCRLLGCRRDEVVLVTLHGLPPLHFRLDIESGRLAAFCEHPPGVPTAHSLLQIDVEKLATAARQGGKALFLALMRGKGVRLNGRRPPWCKITRKLNISSNSLELLNRWFFPLSGTGIVLWLEDEALPCIFYGMDTRLHRGSRSPSMVEFTQQFRCRHHLTLVTSLSVSFLHRSLTQEIDLIQFLSEYGRQWVMSVPVEFNDWILRFHDFYRFAPWKETCRRCHIDRAHIVSLVRDYLANASKYLRRNSVYLHLQDHEQTLLLEITTEGVYEILEPKEIPPENLFAVNVALWSTFMSWFNDNALRLAARFLDEVVPAEISEKFSREEALLYLVVEGESGDRADLFICGGEHDLPGYWEGDFSAVLLHKASRKVLFSEILTDAPLVIADRGRACQLSFPAASCLGGKSVQVEYVREGKTACGIARMISETSLLSEIAPGLCCRAILGKTDAGPEIAMGDVKYKIAGGSLFYLKSHGRIVKRQGFMHNILHAWITPNQGGIAVSGVPDFKSDVYPWWKELMEVTGQVVLTVDYNGPLEYLPPRVSLPRAVNESAVETACLSWQTPHRVEVRLWSLCAWAVPFDKRGNFLLRIRALASIGQEYGFALLEFPCSIPGVIDRMHPVPVTVRQQKHGISFFCGEMEIFRSHGRRYLNRHKAGWRWWWRRPWRRDF